MQVKGAANGFTIVAAALGNNGDGSNALPTPVAVPYPSFPATPPAAPAMPAAPATSAAAEASEQPAASAESAATEEQENLHVITSPIVGTFYRAPAPDADPFVKVGDHVGSRSF